MKVYELIQELCEYDADCEVKIKVELDDVEVEFEEQDKKSETSILVNFEDNCDINVETERNYRSKETVVLSGYFS